MVWQAKHLTLYLREKAGMAFAWLVRNTKAKDVSRIKESGALEMNFMIVSFRIGSSRLATDPPEFQSATTGAKFRRARQPGLSIAAEYCH
jgi:hypothetical protein